MRGIKPNGRQRAEIRKYGRNADGRPYLPSDWLVLKETDRLYLLEHKYKQNFKIRLIKK